MGGVFQNSALTTTAQKMYIVPEAQAFINAAGITSSVQRVAVNELVLDLKSYGIWTKSKALYPIVGGTSAAHAVNLRTPGTYNLSFTGGWLHSVNGMTPNGTSDYANTGIVPSAFFNSINNVGVSFYLRTNNSYSNQPNHGLIPGTTSDRLYFATQNTFYGIIGVESSTTYMTTYSNADKKGFYTNTRTASNLRSSYKNGVLKNTNTVNDVGGTLGSIAYYISAANGPYIGVTYDIQQVAFYCFHDGLTDTEAANFYTAVQKFQTLLGRQV